MTRRDPALSESISQARRASADGLVEEAIRIVDAEPRLKADGSCVDVGAVKSTRDRVDTRLWLASRLHPEAYAERREVRIDGKIDLQVAELLERREKRLAEIIGEAERVD
ncbi:MAG: hypothetical protein KKC18_08100 [Chloroflexi bacterium]|nr:hypothetical protein [Chloroflexota bacterium]